MIPLDILPLDGWDIFAARGPRVIAGPCSAESEEQVLETAAALSKSGIRLFRAGIWKPRTHPGCFEGVGVPGLEWLREVKRKTGMKVSCEVASARHVSECVRHGVDMVWIGARTTANPFLVQEIADALRDSDMTVLVKNPVNPDLDLWIGALERLNACGIRRLGAIHRGVSTGQKIKYRNDPAWEMPIGLRCRIPHLPIFCDPSHMAGRREYIKELSQRALDLGFEGLMIESHICPDCALSDANQQLTPADLSNLLEGPDHIVVRDGDSQDSAFRESMVRLRAEIDVIDDNLINLLSQRMEVSRRIGRFKKDHNIPIIQADRWDSILERMIASGTQAGLSEKCVRGVFTAVHDESVAVQDKKA